MIKRLTLGVLLFILHVNINAEEMRSPMLGALLYYPSESVGEYFELENEGVLIRSILPESPFAKAGLLAGDVLLTIDGQSISNKGYVGNTGKQLGLYVMDKNFGDEVNVRFLRKGQFGEAVSLSENKIIRLTEIPYFNSKTEEKFDFSKFSGEDYLVIDNYFVAWGKKSDPTNIEAAILRGEDNAIYTYSRFLNKDSDIYDPVRVYRFAKDAIETWDCQKCYTILAYLYESKHEGVNDGPIPEKVEEYTLRAAEAGLAGAQYYAGLYYAQGGKLVQKDHKKAFKWMMSSARGSYYEAVRVVATANVFGNNSVIPKSNENGLEILKNYFNKNMKVPFLGHADLQYLFGYALSNSKQGDKGFAKALIANAAELGDARAHSWLAAYYSPEAEYTRLKTLELANVKSTKDLNTPKAKKWLNNFYQSYKNKKNGMPRYAWHLSENHRLRQDSASMNLLLRSLLINWDYFEDPLSVFKKISKEINGNYKNEEIDFSLLAEWLITGRNKVSPNDFEEGLKILLELMDEGNVIAASSIVSLYIPQSLLGQAVINQSKKLDKKLLSRAGKVIIDSGELVRSLTYADLLSDKQSSYFNWDEARSVYEKLLANNSDALPWVLSAYLKQGEAGGESIRHPFEEKIGSLVSQGMEVNFTPHATKQWINTLWSLRWYSLSNKQVNEYLWTRLSKAENRKNDDDELRYFVLLTERDWIDQELLVEAYERIKDKFIRPNEMMANLSIQGRIRVNEEFVLQAFKNALHLLLTKSASDLYLYDRNLWGLKFIQQGFSFAIPQGDFDAALYFHDAYNLLLNEGEKTVDEFNYKILLGMSELQKATILAESGDLVNASLIARDAIEKAQSKTLIDLGFTSRLNLIYQGAAILINLREYKVISDAFKNLLDTTDLKTQDKNFVSYAALMGRMYALYQKDFELAEYFKSYQVLSDKEIINQNPQVARTVFAAQVYKLVFFDKNYDLANEIIRSMRRESIKHKEYVRHWEVQYFEMLLEHMRSVGQHKMASKWSGYVVDLYLEGAKQSLKNQRIITPREKTVISNFVYDLVKDKGVESDLKFKMFQVVQGLAAARAIDIKQLDIEDKRNLLAHSDYSETSRYLESKDKVQINLPTEREVSLRLKDNQALIASLSTDKGTINWLITSERRQLFINDVDREVVKDHVNKIKNSIENEDFKYEDSLALFNVFYKDAISVLTDNTDHIIVIPTSESATLPPSIILESFSSERIDGGGKAFITRGFEVRDKPSLIKNAKWLIERFALSVLPSIRTLHDQYDLQSFEEHWSFLGVGDPVLGEMDQLASKRNMNALLKRGRFSSDELHASLVSLPDTRLELQSISNSFKNKKLLLGKDANEEKLQNELNSSFDVISFASHALKFSELIDTTEPAIVLSKSGGEDGLLTLTEILKSNLQDTKLVMLSACNTASSSKYLNNEAFTGLTAGFLAAGARKVLVSHWPVYSKAAKEISIEIFLQKTGSFAKRLQESMKKMIHSKEAYKRSPSYWAAFSLIGS